MPPLVVLGGEFFKKGEVKTLRRNTYWMRGMALLAAMLCTAVAVGPLGVLVLLLLTASPRVYTVGTAYRARDQTAGAVDNYFGPAEKKWRRAITCRIIRASAFTAYRVRDQPAAGLRPQMPLLDDIRIAKRHSAGMMFPRRKAIVPGVVPRTVAVAA